MAADQERADRIRALKRRHPEYTWQAIADHVGVSLRAAQSWQEKGGIEYENAKKLAALWDEDLDYIMRGPASPAPDLMATLGDGDRLARIETKLDEILNRLPAAPPLTGRDASLHAEDQLRQAEHPDDTQTQPGEQHG